MFVDTHAHLEMLEDVEVVIKRALAHGVSRVVAVSSNLESSRRTLEIARTFPQVFAAVGVHPHEALSLNKEVLEELEKLSENQKVVAIGETGLDYHYMNSPREVQIASFKNHIELAKRLSLPLVIHVRDAHEDMVSILKEQIAEGVKGVIHCFTGDYLTANRYIDMGFYISFSGIITFKNADKIREAARIIPLERLLIETDSPYLAPFPFRGKRNEPAYVVYVAEKIAELRGELLEKIAEETTRNAKELFGFY
jgi:TatD DNase family protein